MFGITEPAIYGVTLQFKRPFILACLASGIGGAIIGFGGVKQYSAGTNGIFGWLQVINPQTGFDSTVVAAIIACIASFVSAVVLMKIFDKKTGNRSYLAFLSGMERVGADISGIDFFYV